MILLLLNQFTFLNVYLFCSETNYFIRFTVAVITATVEFYIIPSPVQIVLYKFQ